jgi:peroxiredoxin
MKIFLKLLLLVLAFTVASGATYMAVKKWKASHPVKLDKPPESAVASKPPEDTIEGINGLAEGETVTLPTLTTPNGERVNLANLKEARLLCAFVGSICSGCIRDVELWRDLPGEASKRGVAFYLIDISDDLPELKNFSLAYNLNDLPLLYDPNKRVGSQMKVEFLPQYILFTRDGHVVHRWDGIRNYNKQAGPEQLSRFFEPH